MMRFPRLITAAVLGLAVTAVAVPAAHAQGPIVLNGRSVTIVVGPPLPPVRPVGPLPPPVVAVAPIAPPRLQTTILPPLQSVLPPGAFDPSALQVSRLQGERYMLNHPLLFCTPEHTATCETMARQLVQTAPGFAATQMNGPRGYGTYLTYTRTS